MQFTARRAAFHTCLHFIALASLGGCNVGSASQSVTARASLPESASWKKASARMWPVQDWLLRGPPLAGYQEAGGC